MRTSHVPAPLLLAVEMPRSGADPIRQPPATSDDIEMNRPPLSRHRGGNAWLRKLIDCPSVAVIDADALSARIEVAGMRGTACQFEAGLCVGLLLDVEPSPQEPWLQDTTLSLAASPFSCDDALAWDGSSWVLWHRYDTGIEPRQLERLLAVQLGLARRITDSSRPTEGGPGSDIGRLI